ALKLGRDPGEAGGAAGDDDLADTERPGLMLVELERRDELAREGLHLPANRVDGERVLLRGDAVGDGRRLERDEPLQLLDLGRRGVERAGDRDAERRPAPLDDARELADATVGDGERRAVVADRHGDERGVG